MADEKVPKKHTGGRPFQKGVSGNPSGQNCLGTIAKLRNETRKDVIKAMCETLAMSMDDLQERMDEENWGDLTAAEALCGALILVGVQKSCPKRTQLVLDYVVGKAQPMEAVEDEEAERVLAVRRAMRNIPSHILTKALKDNNEDQQPAILDIEIN